MREVMQMVDATKLAKVLLEELSALASNEERDAHDPTWLRGYVTGMVNAAGIALEFAEEDGAAADGD